MDILLQKNMAALSVQWLVPQLELAGYVPWPIHPSTLLTLYTVSSEHARSCNIKAEGAFGNGLAGADAPRLESLLHGGDAEFFVSLGLDMQVYGNGFVQLIRAGKRLVGLRVMPAFTMVQAVDGGWMQITYQSDGSERITSFAADEILMLRQACPAALAYALPSWLSAADMIELAHAAAQYNKTFFKNGAVPEMAVLFEGFAPDVSTKADIKEFFAKEFQGIENARRTLVAHMPDGAKIHFKELSQHGKDGDFIKLLDAARDRIPIAHGVPPRLLGIVASGSLGGSGEMQGQMHSFEQFTLKPLRRRMVNQIQPILNELGLRDVAFEPVDLSPASDDRKELAGLVAQNILERDEARDILGIEKSADAQQQLIQLLGRL